MRHCLLGLVLCMLSWSPLRAQEMLDAEMILDEIGILPTEAGYEDLLSTLLHFQEYPLNVNTAGFDTLKQLFLLSDSQIDNLLAFRNKHGVFLYPNELLLVTGMGMKDLQYILPFITLGEVSWKDRLETVKAYTRQELITRCWRVFPQQEGFKKYSPEYFEKPGEYERKLSTRFQGFPWGTLIKYKAEVRQFLQVGLTLENDPGEAYFRHGQKTGFDFLSFHVSVTGKSFVRRLVLGDYRVQWGQGLIAWSGFASGKSAVAVNNEKAGKGIQPYTSTDENNFFRGVALTLAPVKNWTAELLYSIHKTDAALQRKDTLEEEEGVTASLSGTGYHRNVNEMKKKHNAEARAAGVALEWNAASFRLGVTSLYYHFSPVLKSGGQIYQRHADDGNHRKLAGIYYKTGYKNLYFFGELAWCDKKGMAVLQGLRFSSPKGAASLLYRRYDKRYISYYGAGFGEYSNTSNEEGVYLGITLKPFKEVSINAYYDWFRFFSARYNAHIPGAGYESLIDVTWEPPGTWKQSLRFKREVKPENSVGGGMDLRKKDQYTYQLNVGSLTAWEFRSRLIFARYQKGGRKEQGYLFAQDVIHTSARKNWKIQYRLAGFNTDSYNSRIYIYENNVLYGYSFPMLLGKGWRTYLNLSWKISAWLTGYLKAGCTYYPGQSYLSSGVTRTEGNKHWDLVWQLRIKL